MQHQTDWSYHGLKLLGYDLYKLGHPPDTPLGPGDVLHLNLYWQAERTFSADQSLRLRLLDGSGRETAVLDAPIAGVSYPLSQWTAGEIVRAQFDLFIPGDAAPGKYRLEARPITSESREGAAWLSSLFELK